MTCVGSGRASWAGAANLVRVAQIGKLFSAMATVKQKLLKHKLETLADTPAPPPSPPRRL